MSACDHPKEARTMDKNEEVQTCSRCGCYRHAVDDPVIAFVVGRWHPWHLPNGEFSGYTQP